MSIITKIEQQAHIIIPYFIILALVVNNMPVDFNFNKFDINTTVFAKEFWDGDFAGYFPKPRFKNLILFIAFIIFFILFETNIDKPNWIKYCSSLLFIVGASGIAWGIFAYLRSIGYKINNGVIKGPGKIINDINVDILGSGKIINDILGSGKIINDINFDILEMAIPNLIISIISIVLIFVSVKSVNTENGNPIFSSIITIIGLMCLYLKSDGILGLINGIMEGSIIWFEYIKKKYWANGKIMDMDWWAWFFTLFTICIFINYVIHYWNNRTNPIVSGDSLNPFVKLAVDTNHWILIFIILLLLTNIFSSTTFVVLTILIFIVENGLEFLEKKEVVVMGEYLPSSGKEDAVRLATPVTLDGK